MHDRFPSFLSGIRRGRRLALRALVDRYQSLAQQTVRRHLGRRLRHRVESEDLLNDFWLSVFRRVDRLPNLPNSFALRAYLRRVAFRQVTKQQRRHLDAGCRSLDREVPLSDLARLQDPADRNRPMSAGHDHREILQHLRSRVDDRDWQILQMKISGHSNREIGRTLQIDEGSVRRCMRRLGRALVQFRTSRS